MELLALSYKYYLGFLAADELSSEVLEYRASVYNGNYFGDLNRVFVINSHSVKIKPKLYKF